MLLCGDEIGWRQACRVRAPWSETCQGRVCDDPRRQRRGIGPQEINGMIVQAKAQLDTPRWPASLQSSAGGAC